MKSILKIGLTAIAAVAVMALAGPTTASALKPTQLCKVHTALTCAAGEASTSVHQVLKEGTVGKLLSSLVNVLCLTVLAEATPLALGKPQNVHTLASSYTGCGTGAAHDNCTVTVEEQPLGTLLKTGLDIGSLTLTSGRERLQCTNLGINCVYDNEATLFEVGAGHLIAEKTPTVELGCLFFCPNEGQLDGDLVPLEPTYVLA